MEPNESRTPYVFASYAYADRAVVEQIVAKIEANGIRVWFAPRDILAGWVIPNSIGKAIGECIAFLLFISGKSHVPEHCKSELEYAIRMGKRIIPIFLEDAELSHGMILRLNRYQWLRYSEGEHFWIRLLENLRECRVGQTDFAESKQRRDIYRSLFEAQTKNEAVPLNEIKVVFLGDGEAGKSYTIARLLNDGGSPVG